LGATGEIKLVIRQIRLLRNMTFARFAERLYL
jgi:hypothetical protein